MAVQSTDPAVTKFRLERVQRAPLNWIGWVSAFTAVNGLSALANKDFMVLAGAALPFGFGSPWSHFVVAALLAFAIFLGRRNRWVLVLPLVFYVADTIFAAVAGLWAGVGMHLFVLAMVGLSFTAAKGLRTQLQAQQPASR